VKNRITPLIPYYSFNIVSVNKLGISDFGLAQVSMEPTVHVEIRVTTQQMSRLTRSARIHGDSTCQGWCLG
jgi:hypothetical protein